MNHWERARATISRLAGTGPTIGVGFVVTKENWREIRQGAKLAKQLGADNIRLSAVFQSEDERYFADFYEEATEHCKEAKELYDDDKFTVFNNFGTRLNDLKMKQPDYSLCGFHHLTTYIGGDQNIYRCCVTAYNPLGLLGSIKERRFKDEWFSPELQAKISGFDAHDCPRCMYNDQNHFINFALEEKPLHANFI